MRDPVGERNATFSKWMFGCAAFFEVLRASCQGDSQDRVRVSRINCSHRVEETVRNWVEVPLNSTVTS
eukprot:9487233-Pyramimonas_sp.AAC.1